MDEKLLVCSQCENEILEGKFYLIFKVIVLTEEKEYEIGISRMLADLSEYTMRKMYHLSASEILLLRPDIVLEYLKEEYKEEIVAFHLEHFYICQDCYQIYTEIIPLM